MDKELDLLEAVWCLVDKTSVVAYKALEDPNTIESRNVFKAFDVLLDTIRKAQNAQED